MTVADEILLSSLFRGMDDHLHIESIEALLHQFPMAFAHKSIEVLLAVAATTIAVVSVAPKLASEHKYRHRTTYRVPHQPQTSVVVQMEVTINPDDDVENVHHLFDLET